MPGPQVCVGGCLRVAARGMAVGARLRGGVGDAAPYGLPGNGRQRKPAPHPALRGHLPPRGKARAVVGGSASLRGASGTPPPTLCPGMGGDGSLPLIRPCGATFPRGGRQGLLLAATEASAGRRGRRPLRFAREWAVTEGRGGVGHPALRMGIWKHCRVDTGSCSRAAVPEPPCGRGRACPARGVTWAEVCGSVCREGS